MPRVLWLCFSSGLRGVGREATLYPPFKAEFNARVLAAGLPVSRPAVSQHLEALKDAGLVKDRSEGTRRVYYIDPDGRGELRRWLDGFWDDALDALGTK